jgi:hypothetical protein
MARVGRWLLEGKWKKSISLGALRTRFGAQASGPLENRHLGPALPPMLIQISEAEENADGRNGGQDDDMRRVRTTKCLAQALSPLRHRVCSPAPPGIHQPEKKKGNMFVNHHTPRSS